LFVSALFTKTIMEAPASWRKFQTNPFVAGTALLLGLAWLGLAWLGLAWLGLAWLFIVVFKPCKIAKIVFGLCKSRAVIGQGSFISLINTQKGKKCTT
jgi:hypothetical protein